MIHLQPQLEAQLAVEAEARGLALDQYVEMIVLGRPVVQVETPPTPEEMAARMADLEKFFEEMASHSDKIPVLPDEAFTRESFYQDHD
jgi:cell division GTPase FtsZ